MGQAWLELHNGKDEVAVKFLWLKFWNNIIKYYYYEIDNVDGLCQRDDKQSFEWYVEHQT